MKIKEAKERLEKYLNEACTFLHTSSKPIIYEKIGDRRFKNMDLAYDFDENNIYVNEDLIISNADNDNDFDLQFIMYHAARQIYQREQIKLFVNRKPTSEDPFVMLSWLQNQTHYHTYDNIKSDIPFYNQALSIDADAFALAYLFNKGITDLCLPPGSEKEVVSKMNELSIKYWGNNIRDSLTTPENIQDSTIINKILDATTKYIKSISYGIETYSCQIEDKPTPSVVVRYGNQNIIIFRPFIYNNLESWALKDDFKKDQYIRNDSVWLTREDQTKVYYIDQNLEWHENDKSTTNISDLLKADLPSIKIDEEREISTILKKYNYVIKSIDFDSFSKKYIINCELPELENLSKKRTLPENKKLCKYITEATYLAMLQNKSYRMNSIVSMNDTSESLFLEESLGEEVFSNEYKKRRIVDNKNLVITSLSARYDNSLMWRLYGDNGKGVCLVFKAEGEKIRPIIYIKNNDPSLKNLKDCIKELRKKNIKFHFSALDKYMFFVKSSQFEDEDEYRIGFKVQNKELSYAKYGDLISYYKDFDFNDSEVEDIGIKLVEVIIGANMPYRDVNYPLLASLTKDVFNIKIINNSDIDKLRT